MNTREKGTHGEDKASQYLQSNGYKILFRNFRLSKNEIDIIAEKDELICFVEVKTEKAKDGIPSDLKVNKAKRGAIIRTARHYMKINKLIGMKSYRFDIIRIIGENKIKHIVGAFNETGSKNAVLFI